MVFAGGYGDRSCRTAHTKALAEGAGAVSCRLCGEEINYRFTSTDAPCPWSCATGRNATGEPGRAAHPSSPALIALAEGARAKVPGQLCIRRCRLGSPGEGSRPGSTEDAGCSAAAACQTTSAVARIGAWHWRQLPTSAKAASPRRDAAPGGWKSSPGGNPHVRLRQPLALHLAQPSSPRASRAKYAGGRQLGLTAVVALQWGFHPIQACSAKATTRRRAQKPRPPVVSSIIAS